MRKSLQIAIALGFSAVVAVAAQQNPLVGTWQFNPSKSDFTGDTMSFKQLGQGEMEQSFNDQSIRFKFDGKEVPGPYGQTVAWTKEGDGTVKSDTSLKGKHVGTDNYKLSPDGSTLTVASTSLRPNGDKVQEKEVYQRVGQPAVPTGTSGSARNDPAAELAGKWKATEYTTDSPGIIRFEPNGSDGLTFTRVQWQQTLSGKFDGKDYPLTGPDALPNVTASMKMVNPRSVEIAFKQNGKVELSNTYTVSDDGKTLTIEERAPGQPKVNKAVYDRKQ